MSKIVNLKTCAKTLAMLAGIAAPVAQAVAQANKVPAEVLGETGYEPFKLFQSATCDYFTGKIYWAMLDKDYWATRIIEIYPTTGKGTEVCNFIDNNA